MDGAVYEFLNNRIAALEQQVRSLMGQVSFLSSPRQRIFPASSSASSGTSFAAFTEITAQGTNLIAATDGRVAATSNSANAILPFDPASFLFIAEVRDAGGSAVRYLPIRGGVWQNVFLAKVGGTSTTSGGAAAYEWTELAQNPDGSVSVKAGGRTGSASVNPAIDPANSYGIRSSATVHILESTSTNGAKAYSVVREKLGKTNTVNVLDGDWQYNGTAGASVRRVLDIGYTFNGTAGTCYYIFATEIIDANGNTVSFSGTSTQTIFTTGSNCASS